MKADKVTIQKLTLVVPGEPPTSRDEAACQRWWEQASREAIIQNGNALYWIYRGQKKPSVHVVGRALGITGETVSRRIKRAGWRLDSEKWSEEELQAVRDHYANANELSLKRLAIELGRNYIAIAIKASRLGLPAKRGRHTFTKEARTNMGIAQKRRMESVEERKRIGERTAGWYRTHEHPRGALGMVHSEEVRLKISESSKKTWADPTSKFHTAEYRQALSDRATKMQSEREPSNAFSRARSGKRDDIGIFVRSSWEANYARYLNFLIAKSGSIERWEYEPETFWFENIKRGCRSYKPDFKVFYKDGRIEYHEVKGWMYPRAKTALKRMKKYHPAVMIVLVDQTAYTAIEKAVAHLIPLWESAKRRSKAPEDLSKMTTQELLARSTFARRNRKSKKR